MTNERHSRKFGVSFALLTGVQSSEWVAASKIVRLLENNMQSFTCFVLAFRWHTRGRDCEAESPFPSASALGRISSSELRDGTRDSVLALNHMKSFTLAVLRVAPFSCILCILWFPHLQSFFV